MPQSQKTPFQIAQDPRLNAADTLRMLQGKKIYREELLAMAPHLGMKCKASGDKSCMGQVLSIIMSSHTNCEFIGGWWNRIAGADRHLCQMAEIWTLSLAKSTAEEAYRGG